MKAFGWDEGAGEREKEWGEEWKLERREAEEHTGKGSEWQGHKVTESESRKNEETF